MFDRRDYLDGKCDFQQYYSQFVNESVKRLVLSRFKLDRLLASRDPHLNDIPLTEWDRISGNVANIIDQEAFKACENVTYQEADRSKFIWSISSGVCIAKQAARMIIAENK